ncbi:glycosyltransferase family 9 protein [Nonomuraea jabiensis]|uniref:ADP-heptose:LPS heptosyltransferase n=1 Tax=Nonomuraea jabiensis TaxID=882448 RepID=A0A7W9GF78_9ACTN|nr:glycosyltransferase family 9 protein [Nonomuraea jabiensis]MBB5782735.1 ADP-heptose:LPS heptosyltransferase [Nonomuraea jabiensis]
MALDVLALRGLGLGDLLTAVPALRALRRAFPARRLVLAGPPALAPLLPVDEVIEVRGPGPVPYGGAEVAVNLHGRGPQSTRALRATRPGRLLTHGGQGPPWRADVHEVRRWCDLLEWYGIAADPADLYLGRGDRSGPVVVHPGAAAPSRRWPADRFAAVVAALRARGREVVVTGSPAERELAERVAGDTGARVAAGRTDVRQLARLVRDARLVVCGDTGVGHLATAYRTPSVLLFGPVSPALWGPPAAGPHAVLWKGGTGDPHGRETDAGLLEIGVDEVIEVMARCESW